MKRKVGFVEVIFWKFFCEFSDKNNRSLIIYKMVNMLFL
jgi:hypothetical protein